jgi:DHA2 family multidrug resistance protein-like MFS transporter
MLYSMDLTVLNLAVPALSADLKPSSAELLWIVDIYGFMWLLEHCRALLLRVKIS